MRRNWIGLYIALGCVVGLVGCGTVPMQAPSQERDSRQDRHDKKEEQKPPIPALVIDIAPESSFEEVVVEEVIDGDTIDVRRADGSLVRVRVNTIDAAEEGMPYWLKPTLRAEELVLNKPVFLEVQEVASQPYFRRGKQRLLRDVHIRGDDGSLMLLSEILVEEGLVWVSPMPQSKRQLRERPLNYKYYGRLLKAQERARDAHRGIWHGNTQKTTRSDGSGPRFILLSKMRFCDILCELKLIVIPASEPESSFWIPAFAGMTD